MKANPFIPWIRMVLLCMALVLILSLMTIPLLAKGISHVIGRPVQPEQLDLRPIPIPVPPPPMASNELIATATPAPQPVIALAPKPVPVPIPEVTAIAKPDIAENFTSGSSTSPMIPVINRQAIVFIALSFTILLIFVWLHRMPRLHSLNGKNA